MSKEDIAEECGYRKVKGAVILTAEQSGKRDIFVEEDELIEYWYKDESESFYVDTEEGLRRLCNDEEKDAKEREIKRTLSDKIITADGLHHEVKVCIIEDIKEKLKEFIGWMDVTREGNNPDKYLPKAKEIFGVRLI